MSCVLAEDHEASRVELDGGILSVTCTSRSAVGHRVGLAFVLTPERAMQIVDGLTGWVNDQQRGPEDEPRLRKQLRLLLETQGRQVADMIRDKLPAGTGFALYVFDFGEGGHLAWYVSNANRKDVAKSVVEWAEKTSASDVGCDHKFVDSKHCLKCGWTP